MADDHDEETTQPCPVPEDKLVKLWALRCDEHAIELERHIHAGQHLASQLRGLAAFFRIHEGDSPKSDKLQEAHAKMRDLEIQARELRGLGR